jgi:hypothetical protein
MYKKILFPAICLLLLSFTYNAEILKKIFSFPKELKEISAVEVTSKSKWIWTLQDSGNKSNLYAVNEKGDLINTLFITDVLNYDWEELTSDDEGNLYIGDFGNNKNARKELYIYKIDAKDLKKTEAHTAAKITFFYPEQTEFPPQKAQRYYDLEAFFLYGNTFYLFTKNRSSTSDGSTLLYTVPNLPGNHAARLTGSFKSCTDFHSCAITSADISPNGKKMVLLSYGHIWLFTDFKGIDFFNGKVQQIDLPEMSDKEGICFVGNNKLFVVDERNKGVGGNLYEVNLKKLKTKS